MQHFDYLRNIVLTNCIILVKIPKYSITDRSIQTGCRR